MADNKQVQEVQTGTGPIAEPVDNKTYSNNTEAMTALKNVKMLHIQQQKEAEQQLAVSGKGTGGGPDFVLESSDRLSWLRNAQKTLDSMAASGVRNPLDPADWAAVALAGAGAGFARGACAVLDCGPATPYSAHLQSALRELNHPEDKTHGMDRKTEEQEPEATRLSS